MKIILFCLLSVLCQAQHFLPQPEVVLPKKGEFTFNAETTFFAENKTGEDALSPLLHKINQLSGVSIPKVQAKRENQIQVTVDYSLPQEAYTLDISSDKILIKASGYSGFFLCGSDAYSSGAGGQEYSTGANSCSMDKRCPQICL